ncbi:nitronate monooxygenase family protein [Ferrovum sp. PN-J185]|uniref:NAD(P)H-dependent flavin oxidoreductase n=1 Tax=Ferrovum sp. PN-J185 TaxID=1356306 RepID=UPI0007923D94|nr:nitronate monooxygenase family protein [Ferrovum sp. PN-J185]KXW56435.1 inosine-5'-monophosphate dehydrogenase [Ferrovum sp. PN-J185]MCC6068375.1 nitronate monooxygenase family protein [Ferrovum sp. PN-J185]MDE1892643.1 nitronate monooxygenase [Betaproteobacteria bacterium]MDE2057157.1 nitronate monooxygenase [Betaproteobacteria bacterium]
MIHTTLPIFKFKDKKLLPIVQGGMGIGISAHRLAGTVAKYGAIGTIASIDLRHHHPDLEMSGCKDNSILNKMNLIALDREIKEAIKLSNKNGMIAVNVMKAVTDHAALVRQACESGADAIVMGAGLPLDLPDMTQDFPHVALIPILSDSRGISLVLKKWLRKNRLPDAIVIEHPKYAGGHLGAADRSQLLDTRFDFKTVISETFQLFKELGITEKTIPLIPAGGINSYQKINNLISFGAQAVQIGTPFAVTEECDAHENFKMVLANASVDQITTFMSVAGLPARGVMTPWLKKYLERVVKLQSRARSEGRKCAAGLNCLIRCGLRDGNAKTGQFCIDVHLTAALKGDLKKGLFFRGSEALPFGNKIQSVEELLTYLLNQNKNLVAT